MIDKLSPRKKYFLENIVLIKKLIFNNTRWRLFTAYQFFSAVQDFFFIGRY
jgi:hypothetical protein